MLGIFDEREFLQDNRVLATIFAAIILSIAGFIYFDQWVITSLHSLVLAVLDINIPFPWVALEPIMPALNIGFYLMGAAAIALIGREYIVADRYVYFAVVSYLLYFPLAGINWSTFTTISIFPTLFLLGFYFYKIELRLVSAIFFLAAASTFVIYLLIVLISTLAILLSDRKRNVMVRENYAFISTVLITLLVLLLDASHGNFITYYGSISVSGYGSVLGIVSSLTFAKPLFFIVLLIPLVTFAFFGPRILPVTLPYYIFGIIVTAAGSSPEPLVGILDLILPLAFIASLRWIGKKVDMGILPTETRIIRFALFSLILMNFLVILTYFPFLTILSHLLGI